MQSLHTEINGYDVDHGKNIHPEDRWGRVGKEGFAKTLTYDEMIQMMSRNEIWLNKTGVIIEGKPNILFKNSANSKWYVKKIDLNLLGSKLTKKHEDSMMYIIWW